MTEPRLNSKRFLVVKPETIPGVDSFPTSANGVYAEALTVKKMNVKTVDRNTIKPFLGGSLKSVVSYDASIEVDIAIASGGNAAGVPTPGATPAYDALFRGCGMIKTSSAVPVTGTAQSGTKDSIVLHAGASSTDDAYAGLSIATDNSSGTCQDPGSADKTIIKLNATDKQHAGTLQSGSTTTTLKFAATASIDNDFYVGMDVVIAGETRTITAYNGTAKIATVGVAFSTAPSLVAYTVLRETDYYKDMLATVVHFSGTIVSEGSYISKVNEIYLPSSLGSNNIVGTDIEITTGANPPEKRRIVAYEIATRKAKLSSKISVTPTAASTFKVSDSRIVVASDGTTRILTLASPLKFLSTATSTYKIGIFRLIIGYDGTTKRATVTPKFTKPPTDETSFTMNPYVKYTPTSTGHISNTFYYYEDGALHSFNYARGNLMLDFSNGALPIAKMTYTGLTDIYTDAAFPAFDLAAWVEPLPVNYANTKSIYVNGFSDTVVDKVSIDLGNEVIHLDAPGARSVFIRDRAAKGSITIWAPSPTEVDFYAAVRDAIVSPMAFAHGPMGNQFSVFCKKVQLLNPSDSEKDGIQMITFELNIPPYDSGNNEVSFILQ